MLIDSSGKLNSTSSERMPTEEERIEHNHSELIRSLRPIKLKDPIEYERMIRSFENHDIIAARYRLYALIHPGYFPDSNENRDEIDDLQKLIGSFEMTMVDWDRIYSVKDPDEDYDEWDEEDTVDPEPTDE